MALLIHDKDSLDLKVSARPDGLCQNIPGCLDGFGLHSLQIGKLFPVLIADDAIAREEVQKIPFHRSNFTLATGEAADRTSGCGTKADQRPWLLLICGSVSLRLEQSHQARRSLTVGTGWLSPWVLQAAPITCPL